MRHYFIWILGIIFAAILYLPSTTYAQFYFIEDTTTSGIYQRSSNSDNLSGGVVVFDFDNDGFEDLYLGGGIFPDKLFRNIGNGRFQNVAPTNFAEHNSFQSFTRGGTAFDYNNDGWTDLYITCKRKAILWKNNGDGTFTNVSKTAGIIEPFDLNESVTSTFGDVDGDGDNDLYVARWVLESKFKQDTNGNAIGFDHKGMSNLFYLNNGDGTFTESGVQFGVADSATTNIALFFDYDRDGDLDILIGNDFGVELTPNQLYKNLLAETGKLQFVEVAKDIGFASKLFCMGFGPTDYDHDGDFDFFATNTGHIAFLEQENGKFTDVAHQRGVPNGLQNFNSFYKNVTWSVVCDDFDNDGNEDAFIVHGYEHFFTPYDTYQWDTSTFLRNIGGFFEDVTAQTGVLIGIRGRGGASLDYDRNGYRDIIYGSAKFIPDTIQKDYRLIRNITPESSKGNCLQVICRAVTTAKEALGTTIEVWTDGVRYTRQVSTGGGIMSMNSLIQHFGLGANNLVDSMIVYWPINKSLHRQIDRYYNINANQCVMVVEGQTKITDVRPLRSGVTNTPTPKNALISTVVSGKLTISGTNIGEKYVIYDNLGREQLHNSFQSTETNIDIRNLLPGWYSIHIIGDTQRVVKSFIIIH